MANTTRADTVRIPGPDGPLEGTLSRSADAAHIALIIPGSGPIDRDGNSPETGLHSDLYQQMGDALAARGIAALRIDKRGFAGSSGAVANTDEITIEGYAADMRDWVDFAGGIAPCVWIAGHSEGGLVAMVTAAKSPEGLCGLILMASPGRSVGEIMLEQVIANPGNGPLLADLKGIIADLMQGKTRPMQDVPPAFHGLFAPGLQRYMINLFGFDPLDIAPNITVPVLILQGDADLQITVQDAHALHAAFPHSTQHILPNVTHMMKQDVAGQPLATYANPALPLAPDMMSIVAAFITQAR
ncbi:MAG: alpha/beta fold hydrolase [Pseudomonadota bacterium]